MNEILKQMKINNLADEMLAPKGKRIETMSAEDYREVMAMLRKKRLA